MMLFLTVIILFCFSIVNFTNTIFYSSIDNRFYSSLKSACENSIAYQGDEIFFDKFTLKHELKILLNNNLSRNLEKYKIYINYYYADLTPCNYHCQTVNVRLKVEISNTSTYDKAYFIKLVKNNE